MKKLLQLTAQAALLLALGYAVLWLAQAIGDLLITVFPW